MGKVLFEPSVGGRMPSAAAADPDQRLASAFSPRLESLDNASKSSDLESTTRPLDRPIS